MIKKIAGFYYVLNRNKTHFMGIFWYTFSDFYVYSNFRSKFYDITNWEHISDTHIFNDVNLKKDLKKTYIISQKLPNLWD